MVIGFNIFVEMCGALHVHLCVWHIRMPKLYYHRVCVHRDDIHLSFGMHEQLGKRFDADRSDPDGRVTIAP